MNVQVLLQTDFWRTFWNICSWIQVNLCQKLLFLHQLTHNMKTDCSLNYHFSTWKFQAQNMGRTWGQHDNNMMCTQIVFCFCFDIRTTCVNNIFSPYSELGTFMHWTGNSLDNLLSYCGLVDARISTSKKDLPVSDSYQSHAGLISLFSPDFSLIWHAFSSCLFAWKFLLNFFLQ